MIRYFSNKLKKSENPFRSKIIVMNSLVNPGSLILSVGILFAAFGLGVIIFPKFFAILFGVFFLFFGILFSILAYQVIKFKKQVESRWKDLNKNSTIVLQQLQLDRDDSETGYSINITDDKKITWH